MDAADQGHLWTGPQLAAQLAALNGVAPAPACHAVFRVSHYSDGGETSVFEVPDAAGPIAPATWPGWLASRELTGEAQLRVSLLVLRETLDAGDRLMECTLERRLGAPDGPFHGDPARVDFAGPVRAVRLYRALRNGQLAQVTLTPQVLPPAPRGAEQFAGEMRALEQRFGPDLQVIDTREPTLFEDAAGLASIMHLRLSAGEDIACGIGWHGGIPVILVADFPRFDVPLALPPTEEAAVREAVHRLGLVRHETRLDDKGLAVVARRRGGQELLLLRVTGGRASVEPYRPDTAQSGSPDQRGWLRYVEVHEGLTPLDLYADGASDELVVLTGDTTGHVWRHQVDADGVEAWRRPADDAAAAVLHRERLAPGTLERIEGPPSTVWLDEAEVTEAPPPPDSLLARARAFEAAITALHAARAIALAAAPGEDATIQRDHLASLVRALEALTAEHAAGRAGVLLAEVEAGAPNPDRLARDLLRLEAAIREELAGIRMLPLYPAQWLRLNQTAPFGATVAARFPGCAYDIEEAASCLVVRRPTAAVYHCMKVVERGLLALGRRIGLTGFPGSERGWAAILAAVRPACPPELAPALAQLQRIRQRWHTNGLTPADKYTEAEAELVFQSVGGFMRDLAAHCDESGGTGDSSPA